MVINRHNAAGRPASTNDYKSDPTRYTGCMPASTSRRRQSWKNDAIRHYMPFRRDTNKYEPNLALTLLPISGVHNRDGNLASQMQLQLL